MSAMDIELVRHKVREIRNLSGDDERQHSAEDQLYQAVLRDVAIYAPEPWKSLASEALTSLDIPFSRWCA